MIVPATEIPYDASDMTTIEAVHTADEAFVTGTFGALTPVRRVDGVRIGSGDGAGPITRRLSDRIR